MFACEKSMQPSEMKLRSFQGHEPGWSEQAFQKRRVCSDVRLPHPSTLYIRPLTEAKITNAIERLCCIGAT